MHLVSVMLIFYNFEQDTTGGHGADVIVEMLASASLSKDLKLVANKGRIGVYLLYICPCCIINIGRNNNPC